MKDPAFLFYPQDFLTGTVFFSDEEIGIYIKLLCAQHQQGGSISAKVFDSMVSEDSIIRSKFKNDEDGYYNQRLLNEMLKRKKKSNNLSANAIKRWDKEKQKQCKSNAIAYKKHMPIENEDEDVNESSINALDNKIPPKLEDVESFFVENQNTREEARKFFYHYDGQDWETGGHNPRPISKWRPAAKKWMLNSKNFQGSKSPVENKSEYNPSKKKTGKCEYCGNPATMTVDRVEVCSYAHYTKLKEQVMETK